MTAPSERVEKDQDGFCKEQVGHTTSANQYQPTALHHCFVLQGHEANSDNSANSNIRKYNMGHNTSLLVLKIRKILLGLLW